MKNFDTFKTNYFLSNKKPQHKNVLQASGPRMSNLGFTDVLFNHVGQLLFTEFKALKTSDDYYGRTCYSSFLQNTDKRTEHTQAKQRLINASPWETACALATANISIKAFPNTRLWNKNTVSKLYTATAVTLTIYNILNFVAPVLAHIFNAVLGSFQTKWRQS